MKNVKLYLNYAGYCNANQKSALKGAANKHIKFHALWGLIQHPEKGYILYDTGYTQRFYNATRYFPNKIYALATKVFIKPEEEIHAQLKMHGIKAIDIKHIIITHFHADHIAGLIDFPNAAVYTSEMAMNQAISIHKSIAFSKGILKSLIPSDFLERVIVIEHNCVRVNNEILGTTYDLFGDNSIILVPLPGHAAGMIGVLLETRNNPYFLIADACWLKESYQEMRLPSPIVKLFFHSWSDFKKSLFKVHRYHKANQRTIIVPTHCYRSTNSLTSNHLDLDVL